ncbi:hypothetical protein HDU93_007449 [Gonapodya sp. JEL0774]|nr:hypothetical protein HDU93_007449 [Gonapodya sp. JEL0774]
MSSTESPPSTTAQLSQLLPLLHSSRSSEEKFVALALLPRFLDPSDSRSVATVFEAIDWSFIERLLVSDDGPRGDQGVFGAEERGGNEGGLEGRGGEDEATAHIGTVPVAVHLIRALVDYDDLAKRPQMASLVRRLVGALRDADDSILTLAILESLGKISVASGSGWKALLGRTTLASVGAYFITTADTECRNQSATLLHYTLSRINTKSFSRSEKKALVSSLSSFVDQLSPTFRDSQDIVKFQSLRVIEAAVVALEEIESANVQNETATPVLGNGNLLPSQSPDNRVSPATSGRSDGQNVVSVPPLRDGIADLFAAKRLPEGSRDAALSLTAALARQFGPAFLLAKGSVGKARSLTGGQFLAAISNAACSEARVALDELSDDFETLEPREPFSQVSLAQALVSRSNGNETDHDTRDKSVRALQHALATVRASYSIIESIVGALAASESVIEFAPVEVLMSIRKGISEATLSIGEFLTDRMHRFSNTPAPLDRAVLNHPLVLLSVKVVCIYLTEESEAPLSLVRGIVPVCVQFGRMAVSGQLRDLGVRKLDPLDFLMPALAQITGGEPVVRGDFLKAGGDDLLGEALIEAVRGDSARSSDHTRLLDCSWLLPALETVANLVVSDPLGVTREREKTRRILALASSTLPQIVDAFFPGTLRSVKDVLIVINASTLAVLVFRAVALSNQSRLLVEAKGSTDIDIGGLDKCLDVFSALPRMKSQLGGEDGWKNSGVGEVWVLGVMALGDLTQASSRVATRLLKLPRKTIRLLDLVQGEWQRHRCSQDYGLIDVLVLRVKEPSPLSATDLSALRSLYTSLLRHDRIRGRDLCVQALGGQWNLRRLVELGWTEAMLAMQEAEEKVLKSVGYEID